MHNNWIRPAAFLCFKLGAVASPSSREKHSLLSATLLHYKMIRVPHPNHVSSSRFIMSQLIKNSQVLRKPWHCDLDFWRRLSKRSRPLPEKTSFVLPRQSRIIKHSQIYSWEIAQSLSRRFRGSAGFFCLRNEKLRTLIDFQSPTKADEQSTKRRNGSWLCFSAQLNHVSWSIRRHLACYQLCDGCLHPTRTQIRMSSQVRPESRVSFRAVLMLLACLALFVFQRKCFVSL